MFGPQWCEPETTFSEPHIDDYTWSPVKYLDLIDWHHLNIILLTTQLVDNNIILLTN